MTQEIYEYMRQVLDSCADSLIKQYGHTDH